MIIAASPFLKPKKNMAKVTAKELDALQKNLKYWGEYFHYKAKFEEFYPQFFGKKKTGKNFEEAFSVFDSVKTAETKAEKAAVEALKKQLEY